METLAAFVVGIILATGGVGWNSLRAVGETHPAPSRAAAIAVPGVLGVDKSYARKTGFRYHLDLHIEVDPNITVAASHALGGRVRSRVRERLGWVADVLIHVEPAARSSHDDEQGGEL